MTDVGREVLSALLAFSTTCRKQNIHPARGLLEYQRDPDCGEAVSCRIFPHPVLKESIMQGMPVPQGQS